MRCLYCHNPDTWDPAGGEEMTAQQVVARVLRCRPYFMASASASAPAGGGVTLSGGEPLLQARFAAEVLEGCKAAGIHTAVDTSGFLLDEQVRRLLSFTDLVLLDIKHTDPQRHRELTGGELSSTLAFLDYTTRSNIITWVRQVIVPGWNDTDADMRRLADMLRGRANIARVELLAYHNMAVAKWLAMGREYPLAATPPADAAAVARLQGVLDRSR
jgi:pyruvate formate lyase activating enzyme